MTMGIAPVTGIPLPFVTVGGSSMVANLLAIGMLQAIHARGRADCAALMQIAGLEPDATSSVSCGSARERGAGRSRRRRRGSPRAARAGARGGAETRGRCASAAIRGRAALVVRARRRRPTDEDERAAEAGARACVPIGRRRRPIAPRQTRSPYVLATDVVACRARAQGFPVEEIARGARRAGSVTSGTALARAAAGRSASRGRAGS